MTGKVDGCHQPIVLHSSRLRDNVVDITENEPLALVTPLPRIIHTSQGFQTTMLFPMLIFMVEKYGKEGHAVGYYAGLLASLFPLAQFCSSICWGIVSDNSGQRPWLAFGNTVSAASSLFLGLSKTYTSACTVRFLGGLLNGTLTITKSTIGEICDGTNQAKGFGILNLAWGIGAMAGPVVSGLLAQPCVQYNSSYCPVLLQTYPFLLPCLSATLFSSVAVCASLSLKKTNPRINHKKVLYQLIRSHQPNSYAKHDPTSGHLQTKEISYSKAQFQYDPVMDCKSDHISLVDNQLLPSAVSRVQDISKKDVGTPPPLSSDEAPTPNSTVSSSNIPSLPTISILKDKDVLLSSFCYSMTGLIFIITDELFPMFGASPEAVGGLGFSSADLGIVLGAGGLVLFLYTLLLYPRVAKRFGPLRCFRYGILGSVPLWLLFPACSMLSRRPPFLLILLLISMAARSVVACTSFTGVLILVSNSATSANMGTVTGLSHSLCSFFRAIGPAFGGAIWSYASTKTFPFHQFLAWLFVMFLSLFTFGLSYLLPSTLDQPSKVDKKKSLLSPSILHIHTIDD